jgi:hypothetical protein
MMQKLRVLVAATMVFGLAACGLFGSSTPVTLAQAQAEAEAILNALSAGVQVYEVSPQANPAISAEVNSAVKTAQAAVAAFSTAGANPQQLAEAAVNAVEAAVAVLPIDPITKIDIDLGLGVVDAFIAALPSPVVTPSATTPTPAAPPATSLRGVAPLVPIHAPTVVPLVPVHTPAVAPTVPTRSK